MSSIDQQFVEYIVKSLVGKPDEVVIDRTIDERGVLLKLTVADDDLGRVIGKRGSTAQSIRTLLRALGTKNDARYNLKIVDPNGDDRGSDRASGADYRRDDDNRASDSGFSDDAQPAQDDTVDSAVKDDAKSIVTDEDAVITAATSDEVQTDEQDEPAVESKSSLADKTRKELAELDDLDI